MDDVTEPATVSVVSEHAHAWDPLTGACTVADCMRRKPQWLIDTEAEDPSSQPASGGMLGAWRNIPRTGRWILIGALIAILANMLLPTLTSSLTNGTLPGMSDDPVVQYVNPTIEAPTGEGTVTVPLPDPGATVVDPGQAPADRNMPYVDDSCESGWGMNGACGGE